jgi:uncharacterized protein YndB with AHSA1/START domain
MKNSIKHQFEFTHAPEVVWDYLTKPELLALWLMENNFQPIVGHQFTFRTKPKVKFGFDGVVYCEVLEIVPHQRLSYSWKGGMSIEKPLLDTVVEWTLTPTENGTTLLLEHRGFKGFKNYFPYLMMNMGWGKIGKRLGKRLNAADHVASNA